MTARRIPEGDKYYAHSQGVPATVWVITHNLGKRPAVHVEDSAGTVTVTRIDHVSDDQCTSTSSVPFSGSAYCS